MKKPTEGHTHTRRQTRRVLQRETHTDKDRQG